MTLTRDCQLCKNNKQATRDAKIVGGPWAYACELCFQMYCSQTKGLSSIINQDELERQTTGGDIDESDG